MYTLLSPPVRVTLHALFLIVISLTAASAYSQTLTKITLTSPGPASFSYLPIDLIKKIGADKAEGVDLDIRYVSGGPLAAKQMIEGNSDFAALGMSALATFYANGSTVRSIATLSRAPTFVLSVRSDLKKSVKKIADLKGRIIGVHTGNRTNKSTSRQLIEFMLIRAGIPPDSVNFLPAGQSYEEQHAALASGSIDALMGEEPFSSRLKEAGLIYILADLNNAHETNQALGGPFLYVQIATRSDVLTRQPEKVRRMAAVIRRTLQWIDQHSPDEIAHILAGPHPEMKHALNQFLMRGKTAFSPDGVFRREEVATTERFLQSINNQPAAPSRSIRLRDLIDARYAGWME